MLSKRVPCVINGNVYAADEVSGLACLLSILFDAEHGRTGVKHGKNHDDDDLNERGLGQSEDGVGPRIQLQRAKAERRGDAAQRGERGENIDDFAERPLDGLLSDQRDEDRTDQTGRVVAELIVGQRHGDNGVRTRSSIAQLRLRNRGRDIEIRGKAFP